MPIEQYGQEFITWITLRPVINADSFTGMFGNDEQGTPRIQVKIMVGA